MRKPSIFKGASYTAPEKGLVAFSVPNSDVGAKLIAVRVTDQSLPLIVLIRRMIDEATRPKWYQRLLKRKLPESDPVFDLIKTDTKPVNTPKGHVVKSKGAPVYTPDTKRKGGRVVKNMPKQLRKIKEAQENEG
jgi:hypothetical protein